MKPFEINYKIASIKYKDQLDDYGAAAENWAESINDAWKLFEEMPNAGLAHYNNGELGKLKYSYRVTLLTNSIGMPPVSADTAPLAICKAWLSWKSNV